MAVLYLGRKDTCILCFKHNIQRKLLALWIHLDTLTEPVNQAARPKKPPSISPPRCSTR